MGWAAGKRGSVSVLFRMNARGGIALVGTADIGAAIENGVCVAAGSVSAGKAEVGDLRLSAGGAERVLR
jgi:hypothetical protein